MTMRAMRTMIAMPLLVLYQRYVYVVTREGVYSALVCDDSSLSSRFVGVSEKGFGPRVGAGGTTPRSMMPIS